MRSFQRVDKVDTLDRGRKTPVYFVKLFSSAHLVYGREQFHEKQGTVRFSQ